MNIAYVLGYLAERFGGPVIVAKTKGALLTDLGHTVTLCVATMNPETLSGQLDAAGFSLDFLESFNSINAVRWYLEENPTARATRLFVLFRKECIDFEGNDPFEGAGVSYEIYDKMRGLSIEAFDGYQWYRVWDSQTNLALEAEELAEEEVLGADRSNVTATLGGIDDLSEQDLDPMAALEEQLKPPVAVPVAVRAGPQPGCASMAA